MSQFSGLPPATSTVSAPVLSLFDSRDVFPIPSTPSPSSPPSSLSIVRVTPSTPALEEVVALLARSSSPPPSSSAPALLLDWVYSGSTSPPTTAPPLTAARLAWFSWHTDFCFHFCLARGGVYALVDNNSGRCMGAALTVPPRATSFGRMGGAEYTRLLKEAGNPPASEYSGTERRLDSLTRWREEHHRKLNFPRPSPFLHVLTVGVDPACQGMGYGGVLLKFLAMVADKDDAPTFLETAGESSERFFSRCGYEIARRSPVICGGSRFQDRGGAVVMLPLPEVGRAELEAQAEQRAALVQGTVELLTGDLHNFEGKRKDGPLSNWCAVCGLHKTRHLYNVVEWLRRRAKTYIYVNTERYGTRVLAPREHIAWGQGWPEDAPQFPLVLASDILL
ncbi:hypothetical protein TeGR_g9690 [Tetraparma gracilis]|uniref:N-acetyltransferase domain-containing protein n=1 Tax=Tetraparma gracilis TaxID=2962635 RepID=A0ABQ6MKA6_9STRA|nr:hypothetical protein TeGR_g9690 [Tetraparma gracilis]